MGPPGFGRGNFDGMGGWGERYRAMGDGVPEKGLAKSGQKFAFHYALPVDATGELPDGRKFSDIREFKRLLLNDEKVGEVTGATPDKGPIALQSEGAEIQFRNVLLKKL